MSSVSLKVQVKRVIDRKEEPKPARMRSFTPDTSAAASRVASGAASRVASVAASRVASRVASCVASGAASSAASRVASPQLGKGACVCLQEASTAFLTFGSQDQPPFGVFTQMRRRQNFDVMAEMDGTVC